MILNKTPLSVAQAKTYVSDFEDRKVLEDYFRKFSSMAPEKAEKLAADIRALNNVKIKEENIMKVVDFLPKDKEELNKIFIEVSLSEEEANAILDLVKKY